MQVKITVIKSLFYIKNFPKKIKKIKALENDNFSISFEAIDQNFNERFGNDNNSLRCDYFTLTIYHRLFIADMFPQYDKGIYLDADTVVPGDISKLYQIDLKDNLIADCSDTFVESDPILINYAEKCSGVPAETYINSGVLLMNLKKLRDLNFTEHFLDILNTYHPKTVVPDQDYLNAIANNHVLKISQNWNAMPAKKKRILKSFIIISSSSHGIMKMYYMVIFSGIMPKILIIMMSWLIFRKIILMKKNNLIKRK